MDIDNSIRLSEWVSIIRDIILIGVSIFTGWWAYRTFAHREKIQELKRVISAVDQLHADLFYMPKPENDIEIKEHLERVAGTLSAISQATSSCLYMEKKDRIDLREKVATLLKTGMSLAFAKSEAETLQAKDEFARHSHSIQKYLYGISKSYT